MRNNAIHNDRKSCRESVNGKGQKNGPWNKGVWELKNKKYIYSHWPQSKRTKRCKYTNKQQQKTNTLKSNNAHTSIMHSNSTVNRQTQSESEKFHPKIMWTTISCCQHWPTDHQTSSYISHYPPKQEEEEEEKEGISVAAAGDQSYLMWPPYTYKIQLATFKTFFSRLMPLRVATAQPPKLSVVPRTIALSHIQI